MPDTTPPQVARHGFTPALAERLRALLGDRGMITDPAEMRGYVTEWRGLWTGRSPAILRPASTAECAEAVRLCAEAGVRMVPQAGNTSLVGASVPHEAGDEVVISVGRMNRILDLDPADMTMTVEAGAVLASVQKAAEEAGCLFPLSLGSEGTAQIGGLLGTNAGGNATLRYGNARDLVLGLEVVLPDGRVLDMLRRLRKDNTGYCLRHLFIGAEGTLGIITRAVLKLFPRPSDIQLAFAAVPSVEAALALLNRFQRHDGASLSAFEYMGRFGLELVFRHIPGAADPFGARHEHYCLVELSSPRPDAGLRHGLEAVLEGAYADGLVLDATIAESEAQRASLWRLREEHSEAQKREGASIKNDVSVPVSRVPDLIAQASAACRALIPGVRVCAFGHVGDGNIHFNLSAPEGADGAAFLARWDEVAEAVNGVVRALGGSFSAEHGVGRLKTRTLAAWRAGPELDLMRAIKRTIDPGNLMNPGKVVISA
ncbi:FAD-binding oxidoreductase [Elioraea tepida]|uniref:FAD-binding oxidoreductase n=1 Tax=Elioraea tepida TaxID=2843330 RepID=A0A975TZN5_9PROT|nr:FAD-binding oxidoreductase [Elioraea tepida]QXM23462.1 FAD-binding oxidoreductase [Elioraea tepida]